MRFTYDDCRVLLAVHRDEYCDVSRIMKQLPDLTEQRIRTALRRLSRNKLTGYSGGFYSKGEGYITGGYVTKGWCADYRPDLYGLQHLMMDYAANYVVGQGCAA